MYTNDSLHGVCFPTVESKVYSYCKIAKFLDTRKHCCNLPKIQAKMPNLREFHQKGANGTANSEDPDQTGSVLFVQTYLSENLGSLRYIGKSIFNDHLGSSTDQNHVITNHVIKRFSVLLLDKK